ncbi:hypothetical protein BLNAU_21729 [Blattamonas nauphoetae]|uniref:Cyclin N-terminal domain-containing protein n=1 Tax=Blattamonas nauphoetae TaxID=2049346 RepID=A0ABQ9WV55_9EUKA|nr:hypothetical protein BLNAU_21729 [Blattamonas nauphoetae]
MTVINCAPSQQASHIPNISPNSFSSPQTKDANSELSDSHVIYLSLFLVHSYYHSIKHVSLGRYSFPLREHNESPIATEQARFLGMPRCEELSRFENRFTADYFLRFGKHAELYDRISETSWVLKRLVQSEILDRTTFVVAMDVMDRALQRYRQNYESYLTLEFAPMFVLSTIILAHKAASDRPTRMAEFAEMFQLERLALVESERTLFDWLDCDIWPSDSTFLEREEELEILERGEGNILRAARGVGGCERGES